MPSKSSKAKLSFYKIGAHANHLHFCSTIKTMARVHERDHELADCKALGSACISYIYHYYTADVIVDLDTDVPVAFSGGLLVLRFLSFPLHLFFFFFSVSFNHFPKRLKKSIEMLYYPHSMLSVPGKP